MKFKLTLSFALLSTIVLSQWRSISPVGTTINDITFTDKYNGYAVFQSTGIGNCTVSHGLYKTINQGKDWIRMNTGNTSVINAVHFINQTTGWFTGASSDIRKTTDGGITWVQQSSGVGSGNNDIWFKDANNGFVIGNNGILRKTTNGGSTWQTIASGVTVTLRRLFFANNNLGFVACGNGQILRTTDGGNTWNIITTGAGGINDIFFADSNTGFISSSNNLYKTSDGGVTWSPITTGATNPILRIFFTNINIGYLTVGGQGIFKTIDGGLTWNNYPTLNGLYDTFYAIYFIDNNTGFIGGDLGKINKTTDGGISWKNMTSGLGSELYSVFATHSDTAYTGGKEGKIFKTENGGVTYFQQTKAFPSIINKLLFTSNNVGFACSDSGRILKTIDGGEHWTLKPTNTLRGFTDMSFINSNQGFASASGGLVFKTSDAGETWDSIQTADADAYRSIWFINTDTGFVAGSNKIQSTYDGGLTWNVHTSSITNSIQDIVFTNDSLGYCAGTFGKILFSTDCGLNWFAANNSTGNAAIEEMWFANDSVGYFAKSTSQSITLDSCKNVSNIATACLANNWTMNSISMTNGGMYGYCVGGLNGVIHQTEQREIYRTYTSVSEICAGNSIFVAYYARGFYGANNVFTAQLSDATGSFANPINIGTYTATPYTYQSGVIYVTIPMGTLAGNNYRIRVVASDPLTIGVDNGYAITIQPSFIPSVVLNSSNNNTVCSGSTITFTTTPYAGGINPVYSWTINGSNINNNSNTLITNTLQDGDTVQVSMQSNLNCANSLPVASNIFIASISNGLPLALANDTVVCENTSFQLNAPSGYNYNWSPNLGLSNPNIANPIAIITNNITYYLTITDVVGCVGLDSISINSIPLPIIDLGSNQSVCTNTTVQLNAPTGYNYQWLPIAGLDNANIANPIATVINDIEYVVTISDAQGCSSSDSIFITAHPLPQISFTADTAVCENSCITLLPIVGGNLQSINWSPTSTLNDSSIYNPTACPINNTSYTATVTDNNQCTNSNSIFVEVIAPPTTPVISFDGVTLTSTMADVYQWYINNNIIVGATSISYVPLINGDYTVQVSNTFGCSSFSDSISVNINAIETNPSNNVFSISPHPVSDVLQLTFPIKQEIYQVNIFNATGSKVYEYNRSLSQTLIIDTKHLSDGVYVISVQTPQGVYNQRLIVAR
ncbi:MAG TPA: YCF48-related protein [Bacteroidia bacterium]|nr:YCF48-related protein [Bacteroidia bacterium]